MDINEWWPLLDAESKTWLTLSHGDVVPDDILERIVMLGGAVDTDTWWIQSRSADGFRLSSQAIEWISMAQQV
ncbi:MAG: hypothetical protein R2723_10750 [Microbacterium sp.]